MTTRPATRCKTRDYIEFSRVCLSELQQTCPRHGIARNCPEPEMLQRMNNGFVTKPCIFRS